MDLRLPARGRFLFAVSSLAAVSGSILLSGCATRSPRSPSPEVDHGQVARAPSEEQELWRRYFAAVEDARTPEAPEIVNDLVALLPGEGKLRWKDGRVLLTTWTKSKYFADSAYKKGHVFPLYGHTWLMAVPYVNDFCSAYDGPDLAMRLRQLIGLPPDDEKDAFLEVWIRPRDVFRACPDPEVTDSQCQVRIPLLGRSPPTPSVDEPPWYCPVEGVAPFQQQGQFVVVRQSHLKWMCTNWTKSFTNEDPKDDYPWTALGYTYDWGHPDDPSGLSEYVGVARAPVIFERLVPTDAYCGR